MANKINMATVAKAEGETLKQEKAEGVESPKVERAEMKMSAKSTHKPGTKKYCPTCNRSVSCPHM